MTGNNIIFHVVFKQIIINIDITIISARFTVLHSNFQFSPEVQLFLVVSIIHLTGYTQVFALIFKLQC